MKYFNNLDYNYNNFLKFDKNIKILDFGCGDGVMLIYLSKNGYKNITGFDIKFYPEWNNLDKNLIFKVDIDPFNFLKNEKIKSYDLIIMKDVIYYYTKDNIHTLLIDIIKLMKKEGHLFLEIFNGSIFTGPFIKYKDIGIRTLLTEHSIKQLATELNLKILFIKGNKTNITGLRSFLFKFLNYLIIIFLKLIYFSERGNELETPKIFNKKILILLKIND